MSFSNFSTDRSHSVGGTYVELVPIKRIRYKDKVDHPNLPGQTRTVVSLQQVFGKTELSVVQRGIHDFVPAEAYCLGWQGSPTLLAKVVEADVPD